MTELTPEQVERLAATVGLTLTPDDLAEVTHRLNGFLEALAPLGELPLDEVEPVPVLPDDVEFP
jgi:Asp-tRNA(Asn)/Glu-tRNA(Gln) amidotransferase C subunit